MLVDDPLLAAALAEATPVPVVLAVALLAGAPFVELLEVPEEVAVLVPPPLEDVLAEEEVLAEAERAKAEVGTPTIIIPTNARGRTTRVMGMCPQLS